MAFTLVPDRLWHEIEPLLPPDQVYDIRGTNVIGIDQHYGNPPNGRFDYPADMDNFYQTVKGWTGYDQAAFSPEDAKAMYYSGYHAARRSTCSCGAGKWTMYQSKCGAMERIEHAWNQLNGTNYGTPVRFYK